jgi:hypothetical protein
MKFPKNLPHMTDLLADVSHPDQQNFGRIIYQQIPNQNQRHLEKECTYPEKKII